MHQDWLVELNALQSMNQFLILRCFEVYHALIDLQDFTQRVVTLALDLALLLVVCVKSRILWLFIDLRTAILDVATLDAGGTV